MRKLKSTDVFKAMRIVKAAGVREEFKQVALLMKENAKLTVNEVGADLVFGVIEGLSNVGAEKLLFDFLAGILEEDGQALMDMHPLDLIDLLKRYVAEVEDREVWARFFDSVARML